MKKVRIQDINIDAQHDGVDIKMMLYNVEKYDKVNFRTITANTILELQITNKRKSKINITSIGLGIFIGEQISEIFTPQKFKLGKELSENETMTYFFYAYEIKLIFGRFKKEKGVFMINTPNHDNYFISSPIEGDRLEKMILEMEEDEMGYNWGSSEIIRLNEVKKYDPIEGNIVLDYSHHYSELNVDSIDDSLTITLVIFNDRFLDKGNEVKSKTIAELRVENQNELPIDILNPILFIKDENANKDKVQGYISVELSEQFPKTIDSGGELIILYDSESIDNLIEDLKGEEVMFLIKDIYGNQYHTNKIDGDALEKVIDEHNINSTTISKKKIFKFDKKIYPTNT